MKCPRCVQRIHRAAGGCPHCGFTLADADNLFGGEDLQMRLLSDSAGLMRHEEKGRLLSAMERFNRTFPQLFVAVHTGSCGGMGNLRQFGFWLLNRAKFEDLPTDRGHLSMVLLVIDADVRSAGISFSYGLDAFLDEDDTFQCLARAHAYWLEGRHAEGAIKVIEQLAVVLKKRSVQVRRNPERFERKVARPVRIEPLSEKNRRGRMAGSFDGPRNGEDLQ